jgi:Ni,Fe-hydrogenase III large subunit/Ni,Fe-hydrogenase III component G
MQRIITDLENRYQAKNVSGKHAEADEIYLRVKPGLIPEIMESLFSGRELRLAALFGAENFLDEGISLLYVFERHGARNFLVLVTRLETSQAASVCGYYPNACYFEREISDGFGIEFVGASDSRRLFLHDIYPPGFHPLLKSFKNQPLDIQSTTVKENYVFRECSGEGIYQIPVGPVHAGIIEPGHFRFSVMGDTIFNLEIRHFYKHRGLEKLAEGKTSLECAAIAEAVSGDESISNAVAFAMAVESISGKQIPPRAWEIRTVLLEMERIYSHLGDLAGMALDVAYPLGATPFFNLREEILRFNAVLTGSRFGKGVVVPGGLKHDIADTGIAELAEYFVTFLSRLEDAVHDINASGWVIDRFETTGVVGGHLAMPLNLSGPTARASGAAVDTRIDHPYGIYGQMCVELYTRQAGDVLARFQVKADEVKNSVRLIQSVLEQMADGPVYSECKDLNGCRMAAVEAARGQNLHWLLIKNGRIERYKIRTASFCNWPAIEHAVMGNIVADFPLINKSLNLSYAGNDL